MDSDQRRPSVLDDAERARKSRRFARLLVAAPVGLLALVMASAVVLRVASAHLGAAIVILILAVGTLVWAVVQIAGFVRAASR